MKTSINAQMRELTDREETIINNAIALTELWGVVFRAAQNATGTAIVIAIIVPKVAIFIVSQTGTSSYLFLSGIQ